MHKVTIGLAAAFLLVACQPQQGWPGSIEALLHAQPERFGKVMRDPAKYRVQIIYTQIDRDENNRPSFRSFRYRVDPREYFYPASTVKLPTALLALEKINLLDVDGLTRDTAMHTGVAGPGQTPALTDESAPGGQPTISHYIRKILLVSDNDAYNRLYEFLGQQQLNESMHARGYVDTRIMHRLEIALGLEENRHTNPVAFIDDGEIVYEQGRRYSERQFTAEDPILIGKAEIVSGRRLERPKDFAEKNAFPLQDLHDVLVALMFPEAVDRKRGFGLTDDDYEFVYRNMSSYPGESGIREYADAGAYPEGYVKFLMFGGDAKEIPDHIRIFNKVGDAYGFLTDAAYVIDTENHVEFILAATVYTNDNETFNDNGYEYDEIGLPFLRDLGQAIYEIELDRPRAHRPDLSRFSLELE